MTGHTSEKRWHDVSDEVSRSLSKMIEFIVRAESMHDELLQAWAYHANDDQDVADQLFSDINSGSPATAEQLAMTLDMKAAVLAAHSFHEMTTEMNAIRRMT